MSTQAESPPGAEPALMPKRIRVVINLGAHGATAERADRVVQQLASTFPDAQVENLSGRSLPEALEGAADNCDLLVMGGGDGTIAAAAAALAGTDVALGILPHGTMNVFATDLGIPKHDAAALETIAAGFTRRVDVGRINGSVFLNNVVFGVFSDLAEERERLRDVQLRRVPGVLWRALVKLLRSRSHRYDLSSEDVHVNARSRVVAVINNRLREAPGGPFARERLDEGVLDIYVSRDPSVLALPTVLFGMMRGNVRRHRQIAAWQAETVKIRIRRSRARVSVDGEVCKMTAPFECEVLPGALRVLASPPLCASAQVPPSADYRSGDGDSAESYPGGAGPKAS